VEDVSDRLDAAVGVPRKAREVMAGVIGMEVVEEQERIELRDLVVPEGPIKMDTRPFDCRSGFPYFLYLFRPFHSFLL
jgi:hypothetical protein